MHHHRRPRTSIALPWWGGWLLLLAVTLVACGGAPPAAAPPPTATPAAPAAALAPLPTATTAPTTPPATTATVPVPAPEQPTAAPPDLPPTEPTAAPAPTVAAPAELAAMAQLEAAPCGIVMPEIPARALQDVDVTCHWLIVPARRSGDGAFTEQLRLGVVVFRSPNTPGQNVPLLMAQGGPGGATIGTYAPVFAYGLGDTLLNDRDIILFDQRGTGVSLPSLDCPELLDATRATIEQAMSREARIGASLAAFDACQQRLLNEGVDLAAFNSLENAADAATLPALLGYERYHFYGVSYGTLLGQHLMRDYPANLASVILDAVLPTSVNFLTDAGPTSATSLKQVLQACADDIACNTTYPDVAAVLYQLVADLNATPATMPVYDQVSDRTYNAVLTGDILIETLQQLLYASSELDSIPALVYATRNGDYEPLGRARALFEFLLPQAVNEGMYASVACAEEYGAVTPDTAAAVAAQGANDDPALQTLYDVTPILDVCAGWQVPPLAPSVDAPVQSDIPTLLLSGDFDPVTPPAYADAVAAQLGQATTVTLRGESHGQLFTNDCADRLIVAFLRNPAAPLDTGCATEAAGIRF